MRCLRESQPGPRIGQYFLRMRSNQLCKAQLQEKTQSLPSIRISAGGTNESASLENQLLNHYRPNKYTQGYRPRVRWPKSSCKVEWAEINTELCVIMNKLRGTAEKKLEKMGNLIYEYREVWSRTTKKENGSTQKV